MNLTQRHLPSGSHRWITIQGVAVSLFFSVHAQAVTTVFFDSSQGTNLVAAGSTSDTISSAGYLFTFTRDKLFTGGVGLTNPVGRYIRVPWPTGLEAQAVTTGPTLSGAKLTIWRVDGQPFAISGFTAKLLASTAGAGAAIEVMPKLDGEDARPDPYMYGATGYYGQNFDYQTPELSGYDSYVISLYVDFALLNFTAVDASLSPPTLALSPLNPGEAKLSWPADYAAFVLEQASTPNATNWVPAVEPMSIGGENCQTTISLTNGARFFRLRSNP